MYVGQIKYTQFISITNKFERNCTKRQERKQKAPRDKKQSSREVVAPISLDIQKCNRAHKVLLWHCSYHIVTFFLNYVCEKKRLEPNFVPNFFKNIWSRGDHASLNFRKINSSWRKWNFWPNFWSTNIKSMITFRLNRWYPHITQFFSGPMLIGIQK